MNESDERSKLSTSEDLSDRIEKMEIDYKTEDFHNAVLDKNDIATMLNSLRVNEKVKAKWKTITFEDFERILENSDKTMEAMTRNEMIICLNAVVKSLLKANLHFCKSWNKTKLSDFIRTVLCQSSIHQSRTTKKKRRRNPQKLATLCKRVINKMPKSILNAVVAEYEMVDEVYQWRLNGPFTTVTEVGTDKVSWFSLPEYNSGTLSYIFSFLDVHHLITNCRIKVCKDGLHERGINKQAWIDVAKSNTTKLKVPHVEDLVDKQSDSIARATFSEEVENAMRSHYQREAHFCKLVREFYEAEDDPGLSVNERFWRRMEFRRWLLEDVNFCKFPPYGSHVRSIPMVMFQGFLTNIERRIQLFPYVKSGRYNVRALGSLEAENLFGQFQDLDPKGSGVMKSEDIPTALEHACQLLKVRLSPDRPFHMTLS